MTRLLKHRVQAILKKLGLYHRLKASAVYSMYWSIADPSLVKEEKMEVQFYRDLLAGFRPGDLIFDIGANQGFKTAMFLRLGARVVAVDPDDANREILEAKFRKYRLIPKKVVILRQAVSEEEGAATFWIDEPGSAKNTLNPKWVDTLRVDDKRFGHKLQFPSSKTVETTTLERLVLNHGAPFFIKIDVEGFEASVLRGLRRPVPYLSFEVNLPEFRQEGLECVALLAAVSDDARFNYMFDCGQGLAIRDWIDARKFSDLLAGCSEASIKVCCKMNTGHPVPQPVN